MINGAYKLRKCIPIFDEASLQQIDNFRLVDLSQVIISDHRSQVLLNSQLLI